jgi:catechol 2,3-dioxygenase-like lactoylglutathione lyase family enzyme
MVGRLPIWLASWQTTRRGDAVDFKLELVVIPVSDVDRAKEFYSQTVGFRLEVDGMASEGGRIVQVTPPGSACSIGFGSGLTVDSGPLVTAPPGSQRGLHLAVADLTAARDELIARGIDVGEIRHVQDGRWYAGLDPNRRSYMSFAEFSDPDGNLWLLQEIRRDHEGAE